MTTLRPFMIVLLALGICGIAATPGYSVISRVKDIAAVDGAQENQLIGYGLVIGLNGTGDSSSAFTKSSLANMLNALGNRLTADDIDASNVAAVVVSAKLPPFARPGTTFDVAISSIGGAKSLQGGTLIPTPLLGGDNKIHALAQGPVSLGGFLVTGGGGGGGSASVQQNHTTVGRISGGATVEGDEVIQDIVQDGYLRLNLHDPDFRTAYNLKETINEALNVKAAQATTMATVEIDLRQLVNTEYDNVVDLMAILGELPVRTDMEARIVINENTGTVVAGEHIRLHPVAIAHGNLNITISETQEAVTAPGIGAEAQIEKLSNAQAQADVEPGGLYFVEGATVKELVDSLNQLGVNPRDLITIFQTLNVAGALNAKIVVMP